MWLRCVVWRLQIHRAASFMFTGPAGKPEMAEAPAAVVRLSCRLTLAWCPSDLYQARPKVMTVGTDGWLVLKQGDWHTSGVPASGISDTGQQHTFAIRLVRQRLGLSGSIYGCRRCQMNPKAINRKTLYSRTGQ